MFKKIMSNFEQESWEDMAARHQRWLDRATILVIILAIVYFSPVIWNIFTR